MNNKITFTNKISNLKINSPYVISANNINEIKRVVNNISDISNLKISGNELFKFISIYIPKTLDFRKIYDIEFKFSNDKSFLNSKILKLSDNSFKCLKFNEDKYDNFLKRFIDKNEFGTVLIFEINEEIKKNYNFIKFKIIESNFILLETY